MVPRKKDKFFLVSLEQGVLQVDQVVCSGLPSTWPLYCIPRLPYRLSSPLSPLDCAAL